jgi:cytidyltransferase-like protein
MSIGKPAVVVSGAFDNIGAQDLRLLEEASKLGELTVLLWPDEAGPALTGLPYKFPLAERQYFLNAVRYVSQVIPVSGPIHSGELPLVKGLHAAIWVDRESAENARRHDFSQNHRLKYVVVPEPALYIWPEPAPMPSTPGKKRVVVTGCYDWFHSGHVRFTEEVGSYGDLYVIVGHDVNIRLLKGEGHPLLPEAQRRYVVGSIKYVKQALVSTGEGWLDADPEIRRIKPDIYAVNDDGDKGGKREYCQQMGIEYLVLKRTPAPGLPRRSSTDLRGF